MIVQTLDSILKPHSVAVIGASRRPDTIGNQLFRNLIEYGFAGTAYPVNPSARAIQSVRAYPRICDIPEPVDLAVITVPAAQVVQVAEECGQHGVRGLVVISAGFKEIGGAGVERERALMQIVRKYDMRMVGPNCMGVLNTDPAFSMNATFAPTMPPGGAVGFVSQSGALGLSVLDYAREYGIGVAQFVSVGNKPDVSGNDLLSYWAQDPAIEVVLMYVENFGNPAKFLRIAGELTRHKPIIILKSGQSVSGARAATSHTGALAASNELVDALIEQAGALRARSMEELFDMAIAFTARTRPRSRRTAVLTNSGGPGILAADALEANGLELPELSPATVNYLQTVLPPESSLRNPMDMIASARPQNYRNTLSALLRDPGIDSVLSIFVPPMGVRQQDVAEAIAMAAAEHAEKPVYAVLMAHNGLPEGRAELHQAGIPAYIFPESAARGLAAAVRYEAIRQRPTAAPRQLEVNCPAARAIIDSALKQGRERLDPLESLRLLDAYGIPVAQARFARNRTEVIAAAHELSLPIVMKIVAPEIEHKTDVGGVTLDLRSAEDAGAAFERMQECVLAARPDAAIDGVLLQSMAKRGAELIAGSVRDPLFGAAVMVGAGGVMVELIKDVVFRFAPLNSADATEMLMHLRSRALLEGFRGQPSADKVAVIDVLLRISRLVQDFPVIAELEANPLIAYHDGVLAVDARVRLSPT